MFTAFVEYISNNCAKLASHSNLDLFKYVQHPLPPKVQAYLLHWMKLSFEEVIKVKKEREKIEKIAGITDKEKVNVAKGYYLWSCFKEACKECRRYSEHWKPPS